MISPHDEVRIAAHAIVCQRTVRRVYAGRGNEYPRRRVAEAAQQLGLPPPSDPSTPSLTTSSNGSPSVSPNV